MIVLLKPLRDLKSKPLKPTIPPPRRPPPPSPPPWAAPTTDPLALGHPLRCPLGHPLCRPRWRRRRRQGRRLCELLLHLRLPLPSEGDALRPRPYGRLLQRHLPEPSPLQQQVILDVGTSNVILAIRSTQAPAKMYAVEVTKMADHARALVAANDVREVVEVIEQSMEDVALSEKVDVIISEWMGYFLLWGSMFDSVICVHDRWLRQDGVMYPSHARMWLAPIRTGLGDQKMDDFESAMRDWYDFVEDIDTHYGVNMNVLTQAYHQENE